MSKITFLIWIDFFWIDNYKNKRLYQKQGGQFGQKIGAFKPNNGAKNVHKPKKSQVNPTHCPPLNLRQ
jgi:hypothetical protein